jgi:hypothetical protein
LPRIQSRSEPSPAHAINNDDAPVFGVPRCRKQKRRRGRRATAKIASRCSEEIAVVVFAMGRGTTRSCYKRKEGKTAVFGPSTCSLSLWLTLWLFIMFRAAFGACFTCALAQSEHRRRASQSVRVIVDEIASLDGANFLSLSRLVDIEMKISCSWSVIEPRRRP